MRSLVILLSLSVLFIAPVKAQILLLPDDRIMPQKPKPMAKKRVPPPAIVQAKAAPLPVNDAFPRRLRQEELKTLFFNGAPIAARGLSRDLFKVTFLADGQMTRETVGGTNTDKTMTKGAWRFSGDAYCSKWAGKAELCFTVVKDGDTYKVVYGTRAVAFWAAPATALATKDVPFAASAPAPAKTAPLKTFNGQPSH